MSAGTVRPMQIVSGRGATKQNGICWPDPKQCARKENGMAYSTTTDLNNRWGAANIQSWSDLAGAGVPDASRIAAAMAWADAQVDLHLIGGPYALPLVILDASTRLVVTNWSAVLAGHWLY